MCFLFLIYFQRKSIKIEYRNFFNYSAWKIRFLQISLKEQMSEQTSDIKKKSTVQRLQSFIYYVYYINP